MMCERCVRRESILDCQAVLDPGQAAFILLMRCHAEKMERPSGHCKLISPQRWTVQTASNSLGSLHGLPTHRKPHKVHFSGMFGRREAARFVLAQERCPLSSTEVTDGFIWSTEVTDGVIGQHSAADDPLLYLVFSSTLRRWVEVKQTLVSSFWTSKSEVEESKIFPYFIHPLRLASLLLSSMLPCQWFRLIPLVIETHLGGIKV